MADTSPDGIDLCIRKVISDHSKVWIERPDDPETLFELVPQTPKPKGLGISEANNWINKVKAIALDLQGKGYLPFTPAEWTSIGLDTHPKSIASCHLAMTKALIRKHHPSMMARATTAVGRMFGRG